MAESAIKNIDGHPVERVLGSGAAGAVYLVRLPGRQRFAALKLLKGSVASGEKLRFRREFGAIARCSHPGIISVYGIGEFRNSPYYLMEYLKGQDLLTHLRQGLRDMAPLPAKLIPQLVDAGTRLLEALKYLHNHRIIHRDIKPANIMVTEENELKLFDFGLAWAPVLQHAEMEAAGGTAGYQAPEQILGRPVDLRADLYSLGVTLYEILCGINPFGHINSWQELLERQMAGRFNSPSRMNPDLNEDWDYMFRKLLAIEPADRFQSAGQALLELKRIHDISITLEPAAADGGVRDFFRPRYIDPDGHVDAAINHLKENATAPVVFHGPSRSGASRFLEESKNQLDPQDAAVCLDFRRYLDVIGMMSDLFSRLVQALPEVTDAEKNLRTECLELYTRESSSDTVIDRKAVLANIKTCLVELIGEHSIFIFLDNVDPNHDFLIDFIETIRDLNQIRMMLSSAIPDPVPGAYTVQWTPLSDSTALQYLNDLLGTGQLSETGAGMINRLAGGNPGQIRDILDGWILDGSLRMRGEQWLLEAPAVSDKILLQNLETFDGAIALSAVQRTLPESDRLDREILRIIAVFGHDCPFSLLTGVFAAKEELLLTVLDRLIRNRWLVEEVRGNETSYRYATDEVRCHVYQGISPFHRAYLHRRLAEILSRGKSTNDAIELIAYHHSAGDDPAQSLEYLEKAAEIASRRFDTPRALENYAAIQSISRLLIRNRSTTYPGPIDFAVCYDDLSARAMNAMYKSIQESSAVRLEKSFLLAARNRGLIFGRQGEYGQAFEEFQRMLASARDMGSREYEAMALINIGQILYYQKNYDEALKTFTDSLKIWEMLEDPGGLGNCLNTLGAIAQRQNKLDLAMSYYQRALTVKESLEDNKGIAYLKNNLGNILAMKADYSAALDQFKEAYRILTESDDLIGMAFTELNIGSSHHALKKFDDAVEYTKKALQTWQKMKNIRNTALCSQELGQIYIDAGKPTDSVQYLQDAAACFDELGQEADADRCRKMIPDI